MIPRKKSTSDGNDITKKTVAQTKGKKELIIDQHTTGSFFIKFKDGGQLPEHLSGRYTNYDIALKDINGYLAGK